MSDRAAFEITKGPQNILSLSEAQVAEALDPQELLRELEAAFGALARGEVQCPPRPEISVPGKGFSLAMAAWQPGMHICVKVVNVFDGNLAIGLPNHLAVVTLFDPDTGAAVCVMDATYITGIRTAAAAVVSHKLLSRPESRIATIVGAGVQGREHLRLLPLVRDLEDIQICSLKFDHAERMAKLHPRAHAVNDVRSAIGSGYRELTTGPNNNGFPSMSPDGKQFVYRSFGPEGDGLRIMNLETGASTMLSAGYDTFPLWSPRGDLIMFSRLAQDSYEIFTIKPDGTGVKQLTNVRGNEAHMAWSPDGEHIVFASTRMGFKDEATYLDAPQPYGEIFVIRYDGTDVQQLTDNQWEEGTPAWQPTP
jgi:hypothetical protein